MGGRLGCDANSLMHHARNSRTTKRREDGTTIPRLRIASGRGEFVGRKREVAVLRASVKQAIRGHGGIVLLSGEAGIGKTRTAERAATFARNCSAWVCSARGWEGDGAPPFWPWAQVIRTYAREHDPNQVAVQMGQGIGDIVRFMPELRELLPDTRIPRTSAELEPDEVRFRVFESVVTFLKNAGEQEPIVIVFDDLHWADKPSLVLLAYLAGEIQTSRLLIVATYRDWEVDAPNDLSHTVAELARHRWTQHIALQGLTEGDIGRFVASVSDGAAADLATVLYDKTEGNPLFLTELVRLLSTEGRLNDLESGRYAAAMIPQTVRGVIRKRLEALSDETASILEIASVLGREFELAVVEAVSRCHTDSIIKMIDEARAARIVSNVPDKRGYFRFLHVLMRDTIVESLGASRCRDLHNAVGVAIEERYTSRIDAYASVLSYHFFQGISVGNEKKAIEYSLVAAEGAAASLAYEEAALYYRRALEVLGHHLQDRAARCRILLSLGDVLQKGGECGGARAIFLQAGVLARAIGAVDEFGVAAIGFKGILSITDPVDEEAVAFLREALDMLGTSDCALRVRLLSELAMSLYFACDSTESET